MTHPVPLSETAVPAPPALRDLTRVFGKIGLLSFGGPAAQIGLMHRELVDTRHWIKEKDFLGALSFCMLLPGPEAMQLATYAGWRLQGWRGGLIAGGLFVLPGALVVLALALLYAAYGTAPQAQALFLGVKAAVIAIVLQALTKVARKALTGPVAWLIAGAAFLALGLFAAPYPAVIATAALAGAMFLRESATGVDPAGPKPKIMATVWTIALWGALWALPVLAALALVPEGLLAQIGLFFSKLAVLTFGGAYAVLAWLAQEAVVTRGWLTGPEMLDALGLAETTPGPLILVTEFVAALAGYAQGGWPLAVAAAAMGLWVTFLPCFLWIFAAAPWIDRIMAQPGLAAALSGITAAVVGVIAQLAVWFAGQVLFTGPALPLSLGPVALPLPDLSTLSLPALGLTGLGILTLFSGRLGVLGTLALCSAAALCLSLLPLPPGG